MASRQLAQAIKATGTQRGLTLVELVVTIVLMGILAGGTAAFVVSSTQSYVDTATRNQLSAIARLTLLKLEKEIGNAVPNSIRTTDSSSGDQCIEFFPIEDVTRYISVNFGSESASLTVKPFVRGQSLQGAKYPIIFPVAASSLYAQSNPGPLGVISDYGQASPVPSVETLNLAAAHEYQIGTNRKTVYLAGAPVSFCVVGTRMFRYRDYGIVSEQCSPSTPSCLPDAPPQRALVSDQLDNSGFDNSFEYLSADLMRGGLVRVYLNFSDGDESLELEHEINISNAP